MLYIAKTILKKHYFLLVILLSVNIFAQAQSRFFGGASGGLIYYNGDLNDKHLIPNTKIFNPFYNFTIGYNIDGHFDMRFNYYHGNVEGADSLTDEFDNLIRNLSFQSKVDELSLGIYYKLFKTRDRKPLNPYLFAGFGWFFFNPKTEYNGEMVELQPLGTEGQYITEIDGYPKPYKLVQKVLPLGIGVNIRLNDKWNLKVEFAQHFTFTDYLDDVSAKYPDSLLLSYTPNGAQAVALSSRRTDGKFFPDAKRGNIKRNDNYVHFGLGVIYNPQRKRASDYGRSGFFKKLFNGRKGWWGKHGKGLM